MAATNCFRYFGFQFFEQIDQLTMDQYEIMIKALDLRLVDENYRAHRQAFLNYAVRAEKKAGKHKTKPVYSRFEKFYDYEAEIAKTEGKKPDSRFAGINPELLRKEG